MFKKLQKIWQQAWSLILVEMSVQEIGWLIRPRDHISLLAVRRTTIIVTRVRLLAGLFAVLTPLWILLDIVAFPPAIWQGLAVARLATTVAFVCILIMLRRMESIKDAYYALSLLLTVPMAFFFYTYLHMSQFELHGYQEAFGTGYAFLPFVVIAGLSIFPLTVIESLLFALPVLSLQVLGYILKWPVMDWPSLAASFWLLMLIAGISSMAGLSQLAFMIVLVREAIRDSMTGCFSRRSGEELLDLQFILSTRNETPLSLAFIDLDHFKQVNDQYGHEAGDHLLIEAAVAIRDTLRTGDMLIRWGGEEFILIMPNSTWEQASAALNRLKESGYGQRPDGTPVTASVGIAERFCDHAEEWHQLVEMADARMYLAKQSGRDRVLACDAKLPRSVLPLPTTVLA